MTRANGSVAFDNKAAVWAVQIGLFADLVNISPFSAG
ncbi:hypothetical protein SKA53_05548 [Yoonia vestfoldensis SKA53]|uniref:Uncharacterized protein n=1 Tax=Yoonia vestfoldensis SKA53 TaxID=314232 RepID=A3V6K3_9RHOB|nr:hypothetical protein SKA53_05548 [Yoonia vestfoldensis SKA53]